MNNEHEGVDELADVKDIEGDESTDWKGEHKKLIEKAIKNRERNKKLRDDYKTLQTELESYKAKAHPEAPASKSGDKTDEFGLLQKSFLRTAGITSPDEVELARVTAKKWGISFNELDKLVDDDDFKLKLEKVRTDKSNADAVSNLRGGGGKTEAKNTPDYWIAKGVPPSAEQVTDRKTRVAIARAMMKDARTSGKKFYND